MIKTLYPYLRQHLKLISVALALSAISRIFALLDPLIFQYVIDSYATKHMAYSFDEFLSKILLFLVAVIGVALVSRVAKNLQDYYVNVISQKVGAQIYSNGLSHSFGLPYAVFEDQQSGRTLKLLTKVRSDVEKLIRAFVNIFFTSLVAFVFVAIYSCTVHWFIAPVYVLFVPLIIFIGFYFSGKLKVIQSSIVAETVVLAGATTESLRNIELVKSLGLVDQEIKRLNSVTEKILKLELKKTKYVRSLSLIQGTVITLIRASIMLLMLCLMFAQEISVGEFLSLYIYSFYIFGPLQELGAYFSVHKEREASLNKLQEILNIPIESKPKNPISIGKVRSLEFQDVSFLYKGLLKPSTSHISFSAKQGDTIAFVGPSGSGKTTLVKLLIGLYKPIEGEILYNKIPLDELDIDLVREQVGFVTQDVQLFSGTIRDNLLFANQGATDVECLDAINKSLCSSLLERADRGLDTLVGEGGIKISGGEKQRLSIARALLRDPSLLVFDEATSSLDSLTELEICQTVQDISRQQKLITILISHRLSTVMHADTIFVLERGKIIESGKHGALLVEKGLYYAMWRQQVGEGMEVV